VHSNVCILDKFRRSRQIREGGNSTKPFLGKDSTPSHGPSIVRLVSMSIEVKDGLLSNFSQFIIRSFLKLGGIPPSGNFSIFGQ